MNSLTDLGEVVDVVIGVDTHVHTHSAAVVDAATGGVLAEVTVKATAQGYAELVEFANNHATLRAWAIEGTGGHGAGLSRHLLEVSALRVKRWRDRGWELPAAVANAKHCRSGSSQFAVEGLGLLHGLAPLGLRLLDLLDDAWPLLRRGGVQFLLQSRQRQVQGSDLGP